MNNIKQESNIINQLYIEEKHRKAEQLTYPLLEARVKSSDFALIKMLEQRFSTSADLLVREALSLALKEMFKSLESSDRKKIAKDADEYDIRLSSEQALANGIEDYQAKSVNTWSTFDRALTRAENKEKNTKTKKVKHEASISVSDEKPPETVVETPEAVVSSEEAAQGESIFVE